MCYRDLKTMSFDIRSDKDVLEVYRYFIANIK